MSITEWKRDLRWSSRAFVECVWPCICEACGGGVIKPVEVLDDSTVAKDLDVLAGVDVWYTQRGEGCFGIASRVQEPASDGRYSSDTFTIRVGRESGVETEYQKRLKAIRDGRWILPTIMSHAYVENAKSGTDMRVVAAAIAWTKDVYAFMEEHKGFVNMKTSYDESGAATFKYFQWAHMILKGFEVLCFGKRDEFANGYPSQETIARFWDRRQHRKR